jgi:hypothetical protein
MENRRHRFNLPKLKLPFFSGDTLQWLSFLDHFNAAVDSDPSLAPIEKLQYLTAQVTGEAAHLIKGLPLISQNYQEAMELLQNRYGKKEFLVNAYTQAILEIEPPANDVHSLRRFHDQLETLLRGLKSLATTDGTSGSMLVAIIKKKLPLEIRTQIYREQSSSELSKLSIKFPN